MVVVYVFCLNIQQETIKNEVEAGAKLVEWEEGNTLWSVDEEVGHGRVYIPRLPPQTFTLYQNANPPTKTVHALPVVRFTSWSVMRGRGESEGAS